MARPLIADPDLPRKLFAGPRATRSGRASPATRTAARSIRCCCARSTPTWRLRGSRGGPPLRSSSRGTSTRLAGGRVAVVGAGPAGLECALSAGPRGRAATWSLFEAARPHRRSARDRGRRAEPLRLGARCWTSMRAGSGARASSCGSERRRRRWTTSMPSSWPPAPRRSSAGGRAGGPPPSSPPDRRR